MEKIKGKPITGPKQKEKLAAVKTPEPEKEVKENNAAKLWEEAELKREATINFQRDTLLINVGLQLFDMGTLKGRYPDFMAFVHKMHNKK